MTKRTRDALATTAAIALVFGVGTLLSYALAGAGHPSALWLWRDVLGVW